MEKYIIMSRYEAIRKNGVEWTDWFVVDYTSYSSQGVDQQIEELKKNFEYIDKKTKLKHEYKKVLKSKYVEERQKLLDQISEGKKKQEAYYKSDEYKELQKKKRQSAKERKERQKKFLEENKKEEM